MRVSKTGQLTLLFLFVETAGEAMLERLPILLFAISPRLRPLARKDIIKQLDERRAIAWIAK